MNEHMTNNVIFPSKQHLLVPSKFFEGTLPVVGGSPVSLS